MSFEKGGVYSDKAEALPPARFVMLPSKDKQASIEAGYPVFVDMPFIEILKQGGAKHTFPVNDEFKHRYNAKWVAFEAGQKEPLTGLPLEKWAGCTRSECENLKRVNLFTVEQVAESTDAAFDAYGMGGRSVKVRAQKFLESASDVNSMATRLQALEDKIGLLSSENKELKSIINSVEKPKKRKTKST